MKKLKDWFVYSCVCITSMAVLCLCCAILAGVVAVFVSIWSHDLSVEVFKNIFIILSVLQAPFTIACTISAYREENKKSGT